MKKKWYSDGIQFECQGSGQCCVSHGEYGFVYVTQKDRRAMAKLRGLPTREFTKQFCVKEEGVFRLIDGADNACVFLKNKRCTVYSARPAQCKTWPFWPETMTPKAWARDVAAFCPGVGKGRIWPKTEIDANVEEHRKWEHDLTHGK